MTFTGQTDTCKSERLEGATPHHQRLHWKVFLTYRVHPSIFASLILFSVLLHQNVCGEKLGSPFFRHTDDIVWFESTNSYVVFCWGDGSICCLDTETWSRQYSFKIDDYKIQTSGLFLCVSSDKPFLAHMQGYDKLSVYNFKSGENLWNWERQDKDQEYRGFGFSSDGKRFYLLQVNKGIYFLEADTGLSSFYFSHSSECYYYGIADTKDYILIRKNDTLQALTVDDEIAWKDEQLLREGYSRRLLPYYFFDLFNPLLKPLSASDAILMQKDDCEVLALSLLDGSILWKKDMPEEYLIAVTSNRKTLAYWQNGKIWVSHWPEKEDISIDAEQLGIKPLNLQEKTNTNSEVFNRTSDAAFTPDGNYLLILPTLDIAQIDYSKEIRYLARKSNTLCIIDAERGRIIKKIDLKNNHEKKQNNPSGEF